MKLQFVWIAIIVAVMLALMQFLFGTRLPLLTSLLVNEFGFVVCCIGAGTATHKARQTRWSAALVTGVLVCAVFAFGFLWTLIRMYPGGGAG